ncbi:hypothetical protein M3Y99_01737900 [Aphelenchoides fujianensis]|nr:hypothetical protein M3Y99_01737900 [Aphelenchoides fujianensis]
MQFEDFAAAYGGDRSRAQFNADQEEVTVDIVRELTAADTPYALSKRGLRKLLQIVIGFIICLLLYASWYGGHSCFGEGRLSYASGLNFVVVVINIGLFVLNVWNVNNIRQVDFWMSMIFTVLYLIGTWVNLFCIFQHLEHWMLLTASTVLICVEFVLFLFDVKILNRIRRY